MCDQTKHANPKEKRAGDYSLVKKKKKEKKSYQKKKVTEYRSVQFSFQMFMFTVIQIARKR